MLTVSGKHSSCNPQPPRCLLAGVDPTCRALLQGSSMVLVRGGSKV